MATISEKGGTHRPRGGQPPRTNEVTLLRKQCTCIDRCRMQQRQNWRPLWGVFELFLIFLHFEIVSFCVFAKLVTFTSLFFPSLDHFFLKDDSRSFPVQTNHEDPKSLCPKQSTYLFPSLGNVFIFAGHPLFEKQRKSMNVDSSVVLGRQAQESFRLKFRLILRYKCFSSCHALLSTQNCCQISLKPTVRPIAILIIETRKYRLCYCGHFHFS